jgi:predicted AAA+ superfamily ATPase
MSDDSLIFRFIETILPSEDSRRIVILTGARQTGKTTSARRKYPELHYISLDSPEDRDALRLLSTAAWAGSVGKAVLDEAQKEPVVFEKVKYAFDSQALSFSVMLGSSQILLLKKVRESLAGRASVFEIWPLMMSEIHRGPGSVDGPPPLFDQLVSSGDFAQVLVNEPELLLGDAEDRCLGAENFLLTWGGMPALLPLSAEDRWQWLKDYEYTYLERDLGDLARLDDLLPFRTFQKLSALRSGQLLNYSEIARDAGVSTDTARRYLEYLRLSYQTILVQPYYKNITSTLVKTPKIYWLDVGLLRHLTGIHGETPGSVYETMVVGEIIKWIKTMRRNVEVYFYRTRSGLEVDLLLVTQNGIIGVEVKGRNSVVATDWRALREIAERLGGDWMGGLVVYRGRQIKKIGEPSIWAVPSRRLFT